NAACHNLDDVAKPAGFKRFPQWVTWHLRSEFFTYDPRSLHHSSELCEGDFLRQVQASAVRQDEDALRKPTLQRLPDTLGKGVRRLDFMRLHVDDSHAEFEFVGVFLEQVQIFASAPCELESDLLNVGFENGWKQILVGPCPRWLAVSIAVTNM